MAKKRTQSIAMFSTSFLDVLANTIGGLAFLLVLAMMLIGEMVFSPPQIMTEELPPAYDNMDYVTWLGAREGMGKFRWRFGEGRYPDGLALEPETGKLWGAVQPEPGAAEVRQYEFTVICETVFEGDPNRLKEDQRRYALTVYRDKPVNLLALRIMTEPELPDAYRGQAYPMSLAAEGGQPPYAWSVTDGVLPAGLSLHREGRFAGAPSELGTFGFEITVATARGERASRRFTLDVSEIYPPPQPLKVLTDALPAAVAERAYIVYPAAEGGVGPYRWSAVGDCPSWLCAEGGGLRFAGTPALSDLGSCWLTWRVTDKQGTTAESPAMSLEVVSPPGPAPPPLRLRTKTLPEGRVGQAYALAIAVEGGVAPYAWSFEGSTDVPGVVLSDEEGILDGAPQTAGVFPVRVQVTDSRDERARAGYALTIHPAVAPVSILTEQTHLARVGSAYHCALSATGGYPPYQWRIADGDLPEGLTLNRQTGAIVGTPKTAGVHAFSVSVADAEGTGPTEPRPLRVEVLTAQNVQKLVVTTTALPLWLVGRPTEVALSCDGGARPYRWSVDGDLPEGLSVQEGRLTGSATASGDFGLTLYVTDASGQRAEQAVLLQVRRMVPLWRFVLAAVGLALALAIILWLARLVSRYRPAQDQPLEILSTSIPNARASCEYSVQLACAGGVGPYRWRVVAGELPDGLTLDEDGRLHGTPFTKTRVNQTITMPFTVEVRDQRGQSTRQEL